MTHRPTSASAPPVRRSARTRGAIARSTAALTCTTLLLALAAGCSVEVVDARTDDTTATSASTEPAAPTSHAEDGTAGTPSTTGDDDPADTDASPSPVATPAAPTSTVSCGTDGTLVLWQAGRSVALDGDCEHVTIEAAEVQLTAGSITTLEIEAAGVVVHATSVGTLTVAGAENTVVWDEGSPQITDDGAGNVLVAS